MAYLIIDQFQIGLDLRKGPVTSPAQSLRVLKNAIINAGGEIEKRKAFVQVEAALAGTVGLAGANSEFVVFKDNTAAGVRAPVGVNISSFGLSGVNNPTKLVTSQAWSSTYFNIMSRADGTFQSYYNGTPIADALSQGSDAVAFATKIYVPQDKNLKFSAINDPSNWDTTATPVNGSGFIDVSTADAFGSQVLGVERYYQTLAVFGISAIQLWTVDPDPKLNSITQTIGGTGLVSRGAKTAFANGDVIYLARTGIRSLKARDASNFAVTTDVGSPVDKYVREALRGMTPEQIDRIQCVVEPQTGAFWITLGNKILVLSFYPSSNISAWSELELPFEIDYIAVNDYALAIRSGDNYYVYGGNYSVSAAQNEPIYDDTEVLVVTPFLDAKDPAAKKTFRALDASVEGAWSLRYNVNPRNPEAWSQTAVFTNETFSIDQIPMQAQGTHIAFEMRTSTATAAKFSSLVVHFDGKQPS